MSLIFIKWLYAVLILAFGIILGQISIWCYLHKKFKLPLWINFCDWLSVKLSILSEVREENKILKARTQKE